MSVFREAAGSVDTIGNEDAFVKRSAGVKLSIGNSFLPTSTMRSALEAKTGIGAPRP